MMKLRMICLVVGVAMLVAVPAYVAENIQQPPAGTTLNPVPDNSSSLPQFPAVTGENPKGKWLVIKLDQPAEGAFQIIGLWFQEYVISHLAIVNEIMSHVPPDQLGSYELILSQRGTKGFVKAQEIFAHQHQIIFERFTPLTTEHEATEIELSREIIVKIPIEEFDLTQPMQVQVRHLESGATKDLLFPAELLKSLNESPNKPHLLSLLTFWWRPLWFKFEAMLVPFKVGIAEASEKKPTLLCDNLQVVDGMNNDAASSNRANLIFVGFGYSTEETQDIAKELMSALFYQEPFDLNQQAFNAWVAPGNFSVPEQVEDKKQCNCAASLNPSCDLEQRAVIKLCRKSCTSHAGTSFQNGSMNLSVPGWNEMSMKESVTKTWYHEFGHLFGGLKDEYYSEDSKKDEPGYPNCADSKTEAIEWWGEALPKLQFFKGCSYTEDNYRFFENSYMRYQGALGADFGNVHRTIFCVKLAKIAGIMVGPYCLSIGIPGESVCNDGLDNDGDGYTDCDDSQCDMIGGCPMSTEADCGDGFDNDQDGKIDCQDSNCGAASYNGIYLEKLNCEFPKELSCNDGVDNDGDQPRHFIGVLLPPYNSKGRDAVIKADKKDTAMIEWQSQKGAAKQKQWYIEDTVAQWCAEFYPDAPYAKEITWKSLGKNLKNCTQTSCAEGTYMDKLMAVFDMPTWPDGSPNPYYQKKYDYNVDIYECYGKEGVDCSDADCVDDPACQFPDEPVCGKSENKCTVWKSYDDWEVVDFGNINCFNGDDDDGDGAIDCLDIECQKYDYATQPSSFGNPYQCQGVYWKDRALIKQEDQSDSKNLYFDSASLGKHACDQRGMKCENIEVKLTNQPEGWFDVTIDEVFQESNGSYIGCWSWQSDFEELPEDAGNYAFRAVCVPGTDKKKISEPLGP